MRLYYFILDLPYSFILFLVPLALKNYKKASKQILQVSYKYEEISII